MRRARTLALTALLALAPAFALAGLAGAARDAPAMAGRSAEVRQYALDDSCAMAREPAAESVRAVPDASIHAGLARFL